MRKVVTVIAAFTIAVSLAACGDDDDDATATAVDPIAFCASPGEADVPSEMIDAVEAADAAIAAEDDAAMTAAFEDIYAWCEGEGALPADRLGVSQRSSSIYEGWSGGWPE